MLGSGYRFVVVGLAHASLARWFGQRPLFLPKSLLQECVMGDRFAARQFAHFGIRNLPVLGYRFHATIGQNGQNNSAFSFGLEARRRRRSQVGSLNRRKIRHADAAGHDEFLSGSFGMETTLYCVRDLCLAASQLILEFIAAECLCARFGLLCHCSESVGLFAHLPT